MRRKHDQSYRKFCGTPPQNLLLGLEAALGLIFSEGLEAVWRRHAQTRAAPCTPRWRAGAKAARWTSSPRTRPAARTRSPPSRSPQGIDVEALRDVARDRFQVALAGGLGPLTGRAFRIGHLGDCNPAMILGAIAGVEAALVTLGVPFGDGGTRRAVLSLAG